MRIQQHREKRVIASTAVQLEWHGHVVTSGTVVHTVPFCARKPFAAVLTGDSQWQIELGF